MLRTAWLLGLSAAAVWGVRWAYGFIGMELPAWVAYSAAAIILGAAIEAVRLEVRRRRNTWGN